MIRGGHLALHCVCNHQKKKETSGRVVVEGLLNEWKRTPLSHNRSGASTTVDAFQKVKDFNHLEGKRHESNFSTAKI